MRLVALLLAALAVVVGASSPAAAQCRLCSSPTTAPAAGGQADEDVTIEIDTALNFDRLILAGAGPGAAELRPDGSGSATGSVTAVGPRAIVATVIVRGQPNRAVRIDVPRRIDLFTLGGSRITFDQVVTDAAEAPRLDGAGNLKFHIGGRLRFMGDEDGDYRGDLPVTVEYQ